MSVSTTTRYPANVMMRARALRDGGWTIRKIAELLEQEFGVRPSIDTIRYWTCDEYRERRRLYLNAKKAESRARNPSFRLLATGGGRASEARVRAFALELRRQGVGYRAISRVLVVMHDPAWTMDMVETLLAGGTPRGVFAADVMVQGAGT